MDQVGANAMQGSAYVFVKPTTSTFTAKLTSSDGAASDEFGGSVAISSDGSTIIIGAAQKNSFQGAVYIFSKPGSGWATDTQDAILTASDGAANDLFGQSVTLSSDASIAIIGAEGAEVGGNDTQGAAYVFEKPGSGWATTATFNTKLTADDGGEFDALGRTVSISSDGSAAIIGATDNSNQKGAAYVFEESASGEPLISSCDLSGDETTTTFIGTIADNGGNTITECGFYWGTTDNVATLIASGTQVIADAAVQSGDFTKDIATASLPDEYYFVPYATNGVGTAYGDAACSPNTLEPVFSCSYSNLSSTTATLEGMVVDNVGLSFVSYGFFIGDDMSAPPTDYPATGDASGFTANVSSLTPGTTYYFMPYGEDADGEQWSGRDYCQFITPTSDNDPELSACNEISSPNGYYLLATIADNGGKSITECGFYWGTMQDANELIASGTKVTANTVQSGDFSALVNASLLTAGTDYYFVAYAKNSDGTAYKTGCSFTAVYPTLSCSNSDVTTTTATLKGELTDDKDLVFTNYGFLLSQYVGVTPSSYDAIGDATGFSYDLDSLTHTTTYYYSAYAQTENGTKYSSSTCVLITNSPLKINNAFTPNNDGVNDYFMVAGVESYPNNKMEIYNRYGAKVFEESPYKNGWDGRRNFGLTDKTTEILPEGPYYYILDLKDGSTPQKGLIYLKKK